MKTQQTNQAKVIAFRNRRAPAYPNAAERNYFFHKTLDHLLSAASGAGIVTALMCILAFF